MRPFTPDPSNPPAESIEEHTVSAYPKLIIIRFYKNSRQEFFRICGTDADAELKTLLQDLGTEDINVVNSMLCDIKKLAMNLDRTIDWDRFYSILAKVRDEQPRNAQQRQLAVLKAATQNVMFTRLSDLIRCETIMQDNTAVSGLKVIGRLALGFVEAAERSRDQSQKPLVNINVGEGAPTVLNDTPRQPLIEHRPTPTFNLQRNEDEQDVKADLVAPVPKDAEHGPVTEKNPNSGPRFRPETNTRG